MQKNITQIGNILYIILVIYNIWKSIEIYLQKKTLHKCRCFIKITFKLIKKINRDLYDQFYGPVKNIESDYLNTLNVVEKLNLKLGKDHILYKNFQNLYGNSLSSNTFRTVLPHLDIASLTLTDLIYSIHVIQMIVRDWHKNI